MKIVRIERFPPQFLYRQFADDRFASVVNGKNIIRLNAVS